MHRPAERHSLARDPLYGVFPHDQYGLRIGEFILVTLHERFDELRGNQLGLVPPRLNAPRDPMGTRTRFHDHRTARNITKQREHLAAR